MKSMRKIAFILPAFGEVPTAAPYRKISAVLTGRGYSVVPVRIRWDRRVLTDWIGEVEAAVGRHGIPNAVFGFSFGALLALVCASRHPVKKLVLCSPSPYFAEDIPLLPPIAERVLGKRRMGDFLKYRARDILPKVRARVRIVRGERDFPLLIERIGRTERMLADATAVSVKEAVHDLSHPALLEACVKAAGRL